MGVAQFAAADDTTPTPSASAKANPGTAQGGKAEGREGKGGMRGVDTAALATKLGVDEAKLKTALDTARQSLKPSGDTSSTTKPDPTTMRDNLATALAKELGIDKAKVTAALDEVRAAEQATHKADFKAKLDQAVKDGKLTQSEADAVLKAADAGVIGMGGGRGR